LLTLCPTIQQTVRMLEFLLRKILYSLIWIWIPNWKIFSFEIAISNVIVSEFSELELWSKDKERKNFQGSVAVRAWEGATYRSIVLFATGLTLLCASCHMAFQDLTLSVCSRISLRNPLSELVGASWRRPHFECSSGFRVSWMTFLVVFHSLNTTVFAFLLSHHLYSFCNLMFYASYITYRYISCLFLHCIHVHFIFPLRWFLNLSFCVLKIRRNISLLRYQSVQKLG